MMSHRTRGTIFPFRFLVLGLAGAVWLTLVTPAAAQLTPRPEVSAVDHLYFVRAGTFEVWQNERRLGTEFYRVYLMPSRDSISAVSTVRYELRDEKGPFHYEKYTMRVNRALDLFPLVYQSLEQIGGRPRALAVYHNGDTTMMVYHEADQKGVGTVVAFGPGRLYLLDPSVFEHVEFMVMDFLSHGLPTRTVQALVPPRDTSIQVKLVKGPKETIDLPERGKVKAQRVDLYDELTLVQVWVDDGGQILQLMAPSQKLRIVRLPPGEAEAKALAESKGPVDAAAAASVVWKPPDSKQK